MLNRSIFFSAAVIVCSLCSCEWGNNTGFPLTLRYGGQEVRVEDSLRILIIGNSITVNPPLPNIGWNDHWGMAASAKEKDFVHVLFRKINEQHHIAGRGILRFDNLAFFETNFQTFETYQIEKYFGEHKDYMPDLVIFRWGDNTADSTAAKYDFEGKFSAVIDYFKANEKKVPLFIVTSTWYPKTTVNTHLRNVCRQHKILYVSLKGLHGRLGFSAEHNSPFTDGGVASHPGDKGMQAIADSLYQAFKMMLWR